MPSNVSENKETGPIQNSWNAQASFLDRAGRSGGRHCWRRLLLCQRTASQCRCRSSTQQSTLQTATARTGNIILRASGTGTLMAATESSLGFQTSGTLTTLNVQVGSQVKAGDLIAQLDSSNQQLALTQAQQALNQLTSPSAIATAQQAVVTAKTNLINAQSILNGDLAAGSNQSAINNAYAALALAQNKLLAENQNQLLRMSGGSLT